MKVLKTLYSRIIIMQFTDEFSKPFRFLELIEIETYPTKSLLYLVQETIMETETSIFKWFTNHCFH